MLFRLGEANRSYTLADKGRAIPLNNDRDQRSVPGASVFELRFFDAEDVKVTASVAGY